MKNFLLLLSIMLMVALSSCQQGTNTPTTVATDNSIANLGLPTPDNSASNLSEATETMEIALTPPDPAGNMGPGNNDPRTPNFRFDPLGRILGALQLTADQKKQVMELNKQYNECIKAAMMALRESEKPIMEAARAEQKRIMTGLKDGSVTRADARIALKALNEKTRKALMDNPARVAACEQMKLCRRAFLNAIELILTPDQLAKWNDWKGKLPPEVDCTPKDPASGPGTRP